MTMVTAAVVGGATALGGIASAFLGGQAADKAANAQLQATDKATGVQTDEFNQVKALLAPYVQGGNKALTAQQDLTGLNGTGPQQTAINGIQNGPQFQALESQGQNAILQNAAATGGLRGGNVQGALAQFAPGLLQNLIQQQYQNLGGLTTGGQNAAAMQATAGQNTANNVSQLGIAGGNAMAGDALAGGKAGQNGIDAILGGLGMFKGLGGKF